MPPDGFAYPDQPHSRKHGPQGYRDYSSFRDWVRDEFLFRCIFCLRREMWEIGDSEFHLDHFVPVSIAPQLELEYDNLVYSCGFCNECRPEDVLPPRPEAVAYGACVMVDGAGRITALNEDGQLLLDCLGLDEKEFVEWRRRWIRILAAARQQDPDLYTELLRFPDDLPDLRQKHPSGGNTRPEGIAESCLERRRRGELPVIY